MLLEVIEPNWHQLEKAIGSAKNIDDVLEAHNEFLSSSMRDCMLTNPELLAMIHKLMVVCVTYSNCMQKALKSGSTRGSSYTIEFHNTIAKFDDNFSSLLVRLLDKVLDFSLCSMTDLKLVNILHRLVYD